MVKFTVGQFSMNCWIRYQIICSLLLFPFFPLAQNDAVPKNLNEVNKMVWVEGGKDTIGNKNEVDAQPLFVAHVKGFWIQKYEVTNAQFSAFVSATGYVTFAEKQGGSYVFLPNKPIDSTSLKAMPWWHFVCNVNWKHPQGPNSSIVGKDWLPVVHIAYEDANAYCKWANLRLPTEIEREYAARKNGMVLQKNTFQGNFPYTNSKTDGFVGLAPVGSFPPGKMGLYDMQGNVWEWCLDPYNQYAYYYAKQNQPPSDQPLVPKYFDPNSPNEITHVIRGGSFLCADNFCMGYQLGRRMRAAENMTFSHIGFRCVKN